MLQEHFALSPTELFQRFFADDAEFSVMDADRAPFATDEARWGTAFHTNRDLNQAQPPWFSATPRASAEAMVKGDPIG